MSKYRYGCCLCLAGICLMALDMMGCATPAGEKGMVVEYMPEMKKNPFTVSVIVQGGSETGTSDLPNISNEDFAKAIEESIIIYGPFSKVSDVQQSNYELRVMIVDLSRPIYGYVNTVEMEAAWSLMHLTSHSMVMQRSIKSSGTAYPGDRLIAVKRIGVAVERAAEENIRKGLIDISKLDLK
jgi:hypothetical protein